MNLREQIRASGPRQWPGKDLLLDINAKYIIILCTVVVAIFSVLIIIFAHKNYTFWKITRVIAINSFYILFGSLCAILELVLSYYRLIKPVEVCRKCWTVWLILELSDSIDDNQRHDDELQDSHSVLRWIQTL